MQKKSKIKNQKSKIKNQKNSERSKKLRKLKMFSRFSLFRSLPEYHSSDLLPNQFI